MIDNYLKNVLDVCATEFGVSVADVQSPSRKQELVYCRKAYCSIAKAMYDVKLDAIAKHINRTSVGASTLIGSEPLDKYYRMTLERINKKLSNN
jgi:hypothetical protein